LKLALSADSSWKALASDISSYALVHDVTRESVPSEIWRRIVWIIGGAFVGVSALMRLAAPMDTAPDNTSI
jgi:hypothetical protein